MPKLKVLPEDLHNRKIIAKIRYEMNMKNVTHEELALAARITKQTLYHRYTKPDDFRLYELRRICKKLHMTLNDLLAE